MELRSRTIGATDPSVSPSRRTTTPARRVRRRQTSTSSSFSTPTPTVNPISDIDIDPVKTSFRIPNTVPTATSAANTDSNADPSNSAGEDESTSVPEESVNMPPSTATATAAGAGAVASTSRRRYSFLHVAAAWLTHFYTATGVLVNFYALLQAFILQADFHLFAKLNWLAIFIDATDGTMARAINVKAVTPSYDGAMLDNLIDFQTFAVLPALSVLRFELVPGFALQYLLAASILIGSAYAFCQTGAKTPEAFVGFPSYWNIVVFYIYYLESPPIITTIIVLTCAIVSFIPIHFIYPTKTRPYMRVTLAGAYVWGVLMLFPCFFPNSPYVKPVLNVSLLYIVYYFAMSLHLDRLRRIKENKSDT